MSVERHHDGNGSNVDRYDFDRLEHSVEFLITEHQRLSEERKALFEELVDREHRISTLESRLDAEQRRRAAAVDGVDKILSRLEQLQSSVANAVEADS